MSTAIRRARLADLTATERQALLERAPVAAGRIREGARAIIDAVRSGGDAALREANARFGGGLAGGPDGRSAPLRLERRDLVAACEHLPAELRAALETMIANVERFHRVQVPPPEQWVTVSSGIDVGRVWRPIRRVAAYVPGGAAAYPSSLVMATVPARLAGVPELVVASPAGPDGRVSSALAGAAGLLGIEEFLVMGGAQAVAALACGTESIRPADKIVGPGNAWVTAAKLEVFGQVGIDLPAGPSEVMILADGTADPRYVAADLLSQAEHGPDSAAVLVTTDPMLAEAVDREVDRQLATLPRQDYLRTSLHSAGLLRGGARPGRRPWLRQRLRSRAPVGRGRGRGRGPDGHRARRFGLPGSDGARIGGRLRHRIQPHPAHRPAGAGPWRARRGGVRHLGAGAAGESGGARGAARDGRRAGASRGP